MRVMSNAEDSAGGISDELLQVLACPVCRGALSYTKDRKALYCGKCRQVYPIKEGVPVLLPPNNIKGDAQ